MSAAGAIAAARAPISAPSRRPEASGRGRSRISTIAPLLAAEAFSGAVGFGVMIHLARRLGSGGFADFEYGSAIAAWFLVAVRGGFDAIAQREAARRPKLIRPWTDLLLGLRLASAALALFAVAALAWSSGPTRGPVVIASGLLLIPSALAADLGLRATCRFGPLAIGQAVRALALAAGVASLVSGPGRAPAAAGCLAAAEVASSLVLLRFHAKEHGLPRPRFRRRAWAILGARGAVAGLTRFGRVTLYAADMLALGWVAGADLGPYAAARRLAFALLAFGLVVPSALGPRLARAWAAGPLEARTLLSRASVGLAAASWPATVGLIATADLWMARLFGDPFRSGGLWLALIAARLPLVLASNLQGAGLLAARREGEALRLISGMAGLALILVPPLAFTLGPLGVASALLGVEAAGVVAGRVALGQVGLAPDFDARLIPIVAGCGGVALACRIGRGWPLELAVAASLAIYASIWGISRPFFGARAPEASA